MLAKSSNVQVLLTAHQNGQAGRVSGLWAGVEAGSWEPSPPLLPGEGILRACGWERRAEAFSPKKQGHTKCYVQGENTKYSTPCQQSSCCHTVPGSTGAGQGHKRPGTPDPKSR